MDNTFYTTPKTMLLFFYLNDAGGRPHMIVPRMTSLQLSDKAKNPVSHYADFVRETTVYVRTPGIISDCRVALEARLAAGFPTVPRCIACHSNVDTSTQNKARVASIAASSPVGSRFGHFFVSASAPLCGNTECIEATRTLLRGIMDKHRKSPGIPPTVIACATCRLGQFTDNNANDGDDVMPFKMCGRCHTEVYCSSSCQQRAWKSGHSKVCAPVLVPEDTEADANGTIHD